MQKPNKEQQQNILVDLIRAAAEANQPAPSNKKLAFATGTCVATVMNRLRELVEAGALEISNPTPRTRIFTLTDTGRSTAPPVDATHQRQREEALARRDQFAELVAEHGTITKASAIMGISQQRGSQLWRDIINGLGGEQG